MLNHVSCSWDTQRTVACLTPEEAVAPTLKQIMTLSQKNRSAAER